MIVVARGGGSVEDLLPFSDEGLLRAVFALTTPVVSAIGHEPDSPLLDLVADRRAATPTDAAKTVVPDVAEELDRVAHARDRLRAAITGWISREQQRLDALVQGVADVAVVFTTDGRLAAADVVLLADDRRLQPVENVTPVVSQAAIDRHGTLLTDTLNAVSQALDSPGLAFLNWRVEVARHDPAVEARGWLLRHHLVTPRSP